MAPNGRANRNALLFMGAFDSTSSSETNSPATAPPAQPRLQHALPVLPTTTYTMPAATTSTPFTSQNRAVEASALPPAYSPAGRAPIYTPLDPHRGRTPTFVPALPPHVSFDAPKIPLPARSSSAEDVIVQTEFDGLFTRLQQDFIKHAAEEARIMALKNEQVAHLAINEVIFAHVREELKSKQRTLTEKLQNIQVEQARLAGEQAKMERDREVAAAQYAAAVKVQEENELMKIALVELAKRLEEREKALREKEKAPPSSPSAATARDANASGLLAHNFPLTIEQDTLPGLHSGVLAIDTPTTPRMPSTGLQTLRRSSTVVHRVTYNNLALWEEQGIAAQRNAADNSNTGEINDVSITGDSPSKQSVADSTRGAALCQLRHTSSERRDCERGRSIRRISGTMSLREGALWLD
jgi:hypothetical protein